MPDKKILIISYQFCPKGQIGTRRWSKFAKYLSRSGYEVYVISAEYPYQDKVNWCHEVLNNPNIKITRIASRSPAYVLRPTRTFGVKLLDRILSKSIYWQDYTQYWGPILMGEAIKLLQQEGVKHVIATGAPFSVLFQAAQLKKKYRNINLMLDFRDPWSTRINQDGGVLERFRYSQAVAKEKFAIEQADHVFLTTDEHCKIYAGLYPASANKMSTLRNGYDEDDFPPATTTLNSSFRFVYTGALMRERAKGLLMLIEAALALKNESLLSALTIDIYGAKYKKPVISDPDIAAAYKKIVKYCGLLSQQEIFQKINEYPICLTINEPGHDKIIPAKTYDYMGLGKSIFAITPTGPLSDMLDTHGQYSANFSIESIQAILQKLYEDYLKGQTTSSDQVYKAYNYQSLTRQLIQQIERK